MDDEITRINCLEKIVGLAPKNSIPEVIHTTPTDPPLLYDEFGNGFYLTILEKTSDDFTLPCELCGYSIASKYQPECKYCTSPDVALCYIMQELNKEKIQNLQNKKKN